MSSLLTLLYTLYVKLTHPTIYFLCKIDSPYFILFLCKIDLPYLYFLCKIDSTYTIYFKCISDLPSSQYTFYVKLTHPTIYVL